MGRAAVLRVRDAVGLFVALFDATRNLEGERIQQEVRLIGGFDGPLSRLPGVF